MARTIGDAVVRITGDASAFTGSMKGLAATLSGIFAGLAVGDFLKGAIDEAREAAKVGRQTEAVLKSTGGAAKITADQVGELAGRLSELSGVDDEVIQSGANVLLTFTNVRNAVGKGNDIFNQATAAALDMSAALGQDMQSSVIQLGKALNDPIKGITALQRVGVTFTAAQKDQIAALVKTGNVMGAQKIILKELATEFGGAAAAAADPAMKAEVAWGNFKEAIGTVLLPVLTALATFFTGTLVPAIQDRLVPALSTAMDLITSGFNNRGGSSFLEQLGAAAHTAYDGIRALVEAFKTGKNDSSGFIGAMQDIGAELRTVFNFIKDTAIPAITDLGRWFADHTLALKAIAVGYGTWRLIVITHAVALAAVAAWTGITTAATWAQNAAMEVNNTLRIISMSYIGTWIGVRAIELGQWIATTAATIGHTVALGAHAVAMGVVRVATLAWTGVQWLLNAALTANPIGIVIVAIAAFVAAIIYAYNHSETFRKIVQAVWAAVRIAIGAVVDWFVNTAWPWLKKAWDAIVVGFQSGVNLVIGYFRFWMNTFLGIWSFVRDNIFTPIKNFITVTIPNAFKTGVDAIGKAWDGLKELAAKPVRFVIETVINKGIIGTFNAVSGFFHGPQVSPVKVPSLGIGDGPGIAGTRRGVGDGLGFGDIIKVIASPARWVADHVGIGAIAQRFGNNPFVQMLVGAMDQLKDAIVDRIKSLISTGVDFLTGGGGVVAGTGGLQAGILSVLAALRSAFGSVPVISGLRPGSRTLSGAISYHASGRAIDIAPVHAWALFLNQIFGSRLRELITPWNELNIHNGSPHQYTGAVWNQHNFAGGNAHIHAAMDRGGYLMPGWNGPVFNGTGRPEPVTPGSTIDELVGLMHVLIGAVERVAPGVGREINSMGAGMRQIARAY